jgi:hypothetical protein
MKEHFAGFTLTAHGGRFRELITDCQARAASVPAAGQQPGHETFKALWDTGATGSVVTQKVVDKCGLKATGMVTMIGVHGKKPTNTFLVDLLLPNGVNVTNVTVALGELAGADLLIGMDIITTGDFSITNVGGSTVFSFRIPSLRKIDYVEEAKAQVAQAQRIANKKQRKANRHKKPWQR